MDAGGSDPSVDGQLSYTTTPLYTIILPKVHLMDGGWIELRHFGHIPGAIQSGIVQRILGQKQ